MKELGCPNTVQRYKEQARCNYQEYEVLQRGVFSADSGYDPQGLVVKCLECGFIYYYFPKKVKEQKEK